MAASARSHRHRADVSDVLAPLADAIEALTGRAPEEDNLRRFRRYLDLLILWNRTHRLTGVTAAAEIVRDLFVDSLLFLPFMPHGRGHVVDIGTGAGFPGIPLHLVRPDLSMTLIEARRKPCSFLKVLCRELGLAEGVRIVEGRAESVASDVANTYGQADTVVARSVGSYDRLIPALVDVLRPGGRFVASSSPAEA